jgi:hypothetical protein
MKHNDQEFWRKIHKKAALTLCNSNGNVICIKEEEDENEEEGE